MELDLIEANIVLLAEQHNISIVSKEWLAQNDILTEAVVNFAHLPVASVIETGNFNFFVDLNNLRISLKNINKKNLDNLPKIAVKYVEKLPETPYKAVGFNFIYSVKENHEKLKDILVINDEKLLNVISSDYLFGGIIKFDFENFKVTLTLQPKNVEDTVCDFNFHFPSSNPKEIIEILQKYLITNEEAENVIGGLMND
jgi:hypothetical protein